MTVNCKCCSAQHDFQKKPRTRSRAGGINGDSIFVRARAKDPSLTKTRFREILRQQRERLGAPLTQREALTYHGIRI